MGSFARVFMRMLMYDVWLFAQRLFGSVGVLYASITYTILIKTTKNQIKSNEIHLISRDLLMQRHIKNQERFIARRFGVIMTPFKRLNKKHARKERYKKSINYNKWPKQTPLHGWNPFARSMLVYACEYIACEYMQPVRRRVCGLYTWSLTRARRRAH